MRKHGVISAARAATFLTLATVGLNAASSASAQAPAPATDAAAGLRVYGQACLGCHNEEGTGNPGVYPPLAGSEWVNGSPKRLINILLHGVMGPMMVSGEEYTGLMPGWKAALKDEEIAAVATYIRTAWSNSSGAVTLAEVKAVRDSTTARVMPYSVAELIAATAGQ